ncbi:MAG: DeoR family transcriptional regulator [Eubacteriales bacterium]
MYLFMFIKERHQAILQVFERNGRITVGHIQKQFGVGLDSVRRDLRILEGKGLCRRTNRCFITAAALSVSFGMSVQTPESMTFYVQPPKVRNKQSSSFHVKKIGYETSNHIILASEIDILITDSDAGKVQISAIAVNGCRCSTR